MSTVAYLAVAPRAAPTPSASGCAPRPCRGCASSPTRSTPRVPPQPRRSATPGRWRTRAPTRRPRLRPAAVQSAGPACDPLRRRRRHRPHHQRLRPRGGPGARLRVRRHRDPPRPQLPAQRLPQPQPQQAHRPLGRSLNNRARFGRQAVQAVRAAVGDKAAVTAKVNMNDGVPGGLKDDESLEFAQMLHTTARSTLWDSQAAARSPTRCTCSAATPHATSSRRRCRRTHGSGSSSPAPSSCPTTPSRRRTSCPRRAVS